MPKSPWVPAAIAACVVVLDRLSKLYIQAAYSPDRTTPVIPGFFYIVHVENAGAAFGMLAESHSRLLLIAVSVAVMAVIAVMLWGRGAASHSALMRTALSLVMGGAFGNLWDRAARGTVTDFLQFFFGSYEFPSFNAADTMITIGAGLLLLDMLLNRHHQPVAQSDRAA